MDSMNQRGQGCHSLHRQVKKGLRRATTEENDLTASKPVWKRAPCERVTVPIAPPGYRKPEGDPGVCIAAYDKQYLGFVQQKSCKTHVPCQSSLVVFQGNHEWCQRKAW